MKAANKLVEIYRNDKLKLWIKHEAKFYASELSQTFQMNKTDALLAVLGAEHYSLKDKNKAVWALGVLKEKEALPKLESLYTGEDCQHDSAICQYELQKAILKIKGKFTGSWKLN